MQWLFVQVLIFLPFQLMVVVGGQAPKAIRSVECYDFKEERWHQVAELPSRRCRAGKPFRTAGSLQLLFQVLLYELEKL